MPSGPKKLSIHSLAPAEISPGKFGEIPKLKFAKLSCSALDGPPHPCNENSFTSGHSGPPHKKPWNPRIKSMAEETEPNILPTPPRISLILSKIGPRILSMSFVRRLMSAFVNFSAAQNGV